MACNGLCVNVGELGNGSNMRSFRLYLFFKNQNNTQILDLDGKEEQCIWQKNVSESPLDLP